jgi:ankyrin repeat protein
MTIHKKYGNPIKNSPEESLVEAAGNGDLYVVRLILQDAKVDIHYKNNRALGNSASEGHTEIVQLLLEHGANPNTRGVMDIACENGNYDTVKCLLEYGTDPKLNDNSALCTACWTDENLDIVKMLVEYGADIHYDNDVILFSCLGCLGGVGETSEIVKYLIDNGINLQISNNKFLIKCVIRCDDDILKILLESGVDIHARNDAAIKFAVLLNRTKIFRMLIDYGADIHTDNDFVLKWSVLLCHKEIIDILKEMNIHSNWISPTTLSSFRSIYDTVRKWDCEINYEELDKIEKEINEKLNK